MYVLSTAPDKYPDNFRGNPKRAEELDIVWTVSARKCALCKRTQHYCWPTTLNIVGCYMLRPFACCCVLLGIAAESLRPSGDLGDLVEFYCFYLPFETKFFKK